MERIDRIDRRGRGFYDERAGRAPASRRAAGRGRAEAVMDRTAGRAGARAPEAGGAAAYDAGRPRAPGVTGPMDYLIMGITVILTLFGLVMVFSASFYISQQNKGDAGNFFLLKQLVGAGIGILTLLVACYLPYKLYSRPFVPFSLMALSAVLLVVVLFVDKKNDVNRFLTVAGVQFQPSEIARLSLIFFISWWVAKHGEDLRSKKLKQFLKGIGVPLLAAGFITGLILMGRNLSMAVSTLMITLAMLLVAGVSWRIFSLLLGASGVFGLLFAIIEPYRMQRLTIFMDPWKDAKDNGYQLVQSLYALGNGGLFGVGLGNSRQKLLYLPYAESDFILSIIGEEFGFIGLALLMAAFWLLLWRGMLVAAKAPDEFSMMMATGITALIGIQFLINVLVVTSSMPPTGVPLPFISNGNTSLVVFMTAVGILLNISRHELKT